MIDSFTDHVLRQYCLYSRFEGTGGAVVCIGDQEICPGVAQQRGIQPATTREYFRQLGYSTHTDIDYNGKAEHNHDLNLPFTSKLHPASLVYDGGTLEHVCNVGEALKTMAKLVCVGGLIVQESPVVPYGQAYWGVSPLVQRDFFEANGFKEVIHVLHYRKSWKMDLLHAIVTRLPKTAADRLRARVARVKGAKEFVFANDWRQEYIYPSNAWKDRHAFYPHPQTRSLYIGRKVEDVPLRWPHMECYPSAT